MKKNLTILIILCFSLFSCRTKRKLPDIALNAQNCYANWHYDYLYTDSIEVNVIWFQCQRQYSTSYLPNLVFAITAQEDTIAALDMEFEGVLEKGQRILLLKTGIEDTNITAYKAPRPVSPVKKALINQLPCLIDTTYYAKINLRD